LRELSQIEMSLSKALAAHYHGRIPYPKALDVPEGAATENGKSKQDSDSQTNGQ